VPDVRPRVPAEPGAAASAGASARASALILCSSSSPIMTARLSGLKLSPARPTGSASAVAVSRCGPADDQQYDTGV
jgi:hypothetical protein